MHHVAAATGLPSGGIAGLIVGLLVLLLLLLLLLLLVRRKRSKDNRHLELFESQRMGFNTAYLSEYAVSDFKIAPDEATLQADPSRMWMTNNMFPTATALPVPDELEDDDLLHKSVFTTEPKSSFSAVSLFTSNRLDKFNAVVWDERGAAAESQQRKRELAEIENNRKIIDKLRGDIDEDVSSSL